jgi:hypothetical protein
MLFRLIAGTALLSILGACVWSIVKRSRVSSKEKELEDLQEDSVILEFDDEIIKKRKANEKKRKQLAEKEAEANNGSTSE